MKRIKKLYGIDLRDATLVVGTKENAKEMNEKFTKKDYFKGWYDSEKKAWKSACIEMSNRAFWQAFLSS